MALFTGKTAGSAISREKITDIIEEADNPRPEDLILRTAQASDLDDPEDLPAPLTDLLLVPYISVLVNKNKKVRRGALIAGLPR